MRRAGLNKQDRQALLGHIAAKRLQKKNAGAAFRDLEDSDSEEETFVTAPSKPVMVLEDSSEEENQAPRDGTGRAPTTGGSKLNRLRKAGAVPLPAAGQQEPPQTLAASPGSESFDDIASQLGGLSIKAKPSSGGSGSSSARGAAAADVAALRARLDLSRSEHTVQALGSHVEHGAEDAATDCLVLGGKGEFRLNARASTMLYPHQVEGVRWLWSLYRLNRGGILADDMGLGKTIQCAAFLSGLIESRLIQRAVVVAPKTLLAQWRKELGVCGLQGRCHEYGGTANEREAALQGVVRRRGVLLTTYGMVLHNAELLAAHRGHDPDEGPLWDVMICDEGHKLKNPRMQLRKALDSLPVALRVIISGTPIQNNLMELWSLLNFCAPDVLGGAADFRDTYEQVVTVGSDKHATEYERERGAVAAARLRQQIAPYMLRREKKEVFKPADGGAGAAQAGGAELGGAPPAAAGSGGATRPSTMPHKNDLIVWLKLKPMQRRVYQAFLNSDAVKKVFNQTASALAAITVLKKVCDHPALLSDRAAHGIVSGVSRARRQAAARRGGDGLGSSEEEIEDSEEGEWETAREDCSDESGGERSGHRRRQAKPAAVAPPAAAPAPPAGGDEWDLWASADLEQKLLDEIHTTGFAASCKTVFVMALLKKLVAGGHRTLVFSQSRVMLNILEAAIKEEGWRYCRIDGSVASAAEREARVRQFQGSSSIPVFLLTSQVGGLGLTLTGADRVVIVDPAWNPSTDNQSVDRAYRIGQRRDVVVYRLISCGTVEEKIYRRQVFKGGLSRAGMEEGEQLRYFAAQDLRDLFRLDPGECEASRTQQELHALHSHQRRTTPALDAHLAFLATLDCFAGVSDHDLLFTIKEKEAPPGPPITRPVAAGRPGGGAGSGTGAASAGASRPGGVFGKTASQGWRGGSELADMFARVNIDGAGAAGSSSAADVAAAALPPGSKASSPALSAQPATSLSPKHSPQARMREIQELLQRKRHLLTLAAGLADGGARVRSQIVELEQELEEVKKEAAGAQGAPTSGSGGAAALAGDNASSNPSAGTRPSPPAPHTEASSQPSATAAEALLASGAAGAAPPAAPGPLPPAAARPEGEAGPAPAAGAATPGAGTKPPASPFYVRMRDLLFGGSARKSGAASSVPARASSAGEQMAQPRQQLQRGQPSEANTSDLTSSGQLSSAPAAGPAAPRAQPAAAAGSVASHVAAAASTAPPKATQPRSRREVKARLMETLQAIKAAEGGGYYQRDKVDKLRRRAARLAQQYEEMKRADPAAA